jgi:nucleoside-diphosphate-sugar epimerase
MNKPEVLIVGINSFLGRAIYELTKDQYMITGIYNQNKQNIPENIESFQVASLPNLTIRNFKHVYLISSFIPGIDETDCDERIIEANILLPKTVSALFPEARIVFCSSVSVYEGLDAKCNISISDIPAPKSKYALSKLWGECIIKNHASYVIIRISSMYGAGMKGTTFIPKIIESAIKKKEITLLGDGQRLQNYIHVCDVATLAVKGACLTENATLLAVYDRSYSNKEIAEIILGIIPGKLNFFGRDTSISRIYDNAATTEILGTIKLKSINDGLIELIEWTKKKF